jgi:hypothetical protein
MTEETVFDLENTYLKRKSIIHYRNKEKDITKRISEISEKVKNLLFDFPILGKEIRGFNDFKEKFDKQISNKKIKKIKTFGISKKSSNILKKMNRNKISYKEEIRKTSENTKKSEDPFFTISNKNMNTVSNISEKDEEIENQLDHRIIEEINEYKMKTKLLKKGVLINQTPSLDRVIKNKEKEEMSHITKHHPKISVLRLSQISTDPSRYIPFPKTQRNSSIDRSIDESSHNHHLHNKYLNLNTSLNTNKKYNQNNNSSFSHISYAPSKRAVSKFSMKKFEQNLIANKMKKIEKASDIINTSIHDLEVQNKNIKQQVYQKRKDCDYFNDKFDYINEIKMRKYGQSDEKNYFIYGKMRGHYVDRDKRYGQYLNEERHMKGIMSFDGFKKVNEILFKSNKLNGEVLKYLYKKGY